ncbi:MAG: hypothetical protein ACXVH3_27830 [Solirubrobacteraceae bacterium]
MATKCHFGMVVSGRIALAVAVYVDPSRRVLVCHERSSDVHAVSCGWVTPIRATRPA